MTLTEIVAVLVLLVLIGGACLYIRKEKKRGVKCVGCPYAESCAKRKSGNACGGTSGMDEK